MRHEFWIVGLVISIYSCNSQDSQSKRKNIVEAKDTSNYEIEKIANDFYEHDDYPNAIKYFNILIKRDSMNGKYYFRRGYCYSGLINKKKAIDDYNKAALYHFKETSAYFNIGLNYSFEDDSLALQYFEKCIKLDPSFADATVEIRSCRERLRNGRPHLSLPQKNKLNN
jgi:tetratricopeptide (TPR) repeat protein